MLGEFYSGPGIAYEETYSRNIKFQEAGVDLITVFEVQKREHIC